MRWWGDISGFGTSITRCMKVGWDGLYVVLSDLDMQKHCVNFVEGVMTAKCKRRIRMSFSGRRCKSLSPRMGWVLIPCFKTPSEITVVGIHCFSFSFFWRCCGDHFKLSCMFAFTFYVVTVCWVSIISMMYGSLIYLFVLFNRRYTHSSRLREMLPLHD